MERIDRVPKYAAKRKLRRKRFDIMRQNDEKDQYKLSIVEKEQPALFVMQLSVVVK